MGMKILYEEANANTTLSSPHPLSTTNVHAQKTRRYENNVQRVVYALIQGLERDRRECKQDPFMDALQEDKKDSRVSWTKEGCCRGGYPYLRIIAE